MARIASFGEQFAAPGNEPSQEIPKLHVLGEEDADTAKPWLKENAPKAKVEILGRHMMFWEDSEAFNKVFSDLLSRSKNEATRKKK